MIEFSLDLVQGYQRPVIKILDINSLIDTGAMIPTFSLPAKLIELAFNAKLIKKNVSFGGFGGKFFGSIYEIPEFRVGKISYRPFQFFVPFEPTVRHPFLLSASMFYDTSYTFDTINNKFIVKVDNEKKLTREFLLKNLDGKLYAQVDGNLILDDSFEEIEDWDDRVETSPLHSFK